MYDWMNTVVPQDSDPVKTTARELFVRLYADTVRIHNERGVDPDEIDTILIAEEAIDAAITFEKVWEDAVAESVENTEIQDKP